MAKPRKGKSEDQKGENSEAVVRHQKLCLSIDMNKRRIYGYTELEVVVPDNGIVGLHADNLAIESVTVDGEPAEFEVFPHYLHLDNGDRWCSVSSASSAADAAGSVYLSSLQRELVPNLLIMCTKSVKSDSEQQGQALLENGVQSSSEPKQNVKLVRIDYWVEKAETGIHFEDNVLHTNNQIRRARCWFPCMDDCSQCCRYDLEFTVANDLVAVSTGTLLYQHSCSKQQVAVTQTPPSFALIDADRAFDRDDASLQILTKDDPPCKTYVYRLDVPVTAQWISVAVAPFDILPDHHTGLISHMCLPTNLSKLRNTVGFFHSVFSHYEEYLSASFPFGSYTQVFIAPEMAISTLSLGASISVFSSQVLFDEKVIDQFSLMMGEKRLSLRATWNEEIVATRDSLRVTEDKEGNEPNKEILYAKLTEVCRETTDVKSVYWSPPIPMETIETRIKLAYALARQWFGVYITAEAPTDEWLLDGLAWFLTDSFIKRFLGNNEARYRRYKANCAVCKADDSGATALSSSASSRDLYGTQCIGLYGKIRSWKSVAILQMLEKQMGPESFRKGMAIAMDESMLLHVAKGVQNPLHMGQGFGDGLVEYPFILRDEVFFACEVRCPLSSRDSNSLIMPFIDDLADIDGGFCLLFSLGELVVLY
ncbi:unnamed protein product [Ilex paraguariensis]|uniref:Transcription initiation factor TFIID subunit 2 n=1 Tax=Ilex paraguariensis TaxID=185542 RepID=A0ABC8RW67_9AQUA